MRSPLSRRVVGLPRGIRPRPRRRGDPPGERLTSRRRPRSWACRARHSTPGCGGNRLPATEADGVLWRSGAFADWWSPVLAYRVQGTLGGVQRGPCCFFALARRRPGSVGHRRKDCVSSRGQRTVCPLTNPRGLQSERLAGGVLNAGTTKRTSVAEQRFLTGLPPAARGRGPLDPGLPWHIGFEQTELRRQERGLSQRDKPSRPLDRPPSRECTRGVRRG